MNEMSTDELRQAYIDFFVKKHGHAEIPGASLIPENDPTVLFTTAGMHPLVPYLLGEKHPSGARLVDCQKCVRTQDIDEVGDGTHLTFFEMLGNWSLGNYFKQEAIEMSFEFLTEVLQIPKEKIAVTCFGGDDRFADLPRDEQSAHIWKNIGIPQERIAFVQGGVLESEQNWWGPAGQTGPCGPDTEMFFWIGDGDLPKEASHPGNDESNWMEMWNDVFMEYEKGQVRFQKLIQKNVDTGMGLERTAAVLQGVKNVYETDKMKPIFSAIQDISTDSDRLTATIRHSRIIVDHIKAATFIIADGVKPSNTDQGYVLRRLIRRAVRSARLLGIEDSGFVNEIVKKVIHEYGNHYVHLKINEQEICSTISDEEIKFGKTLEEGLKQFHRIIDVIKNKTVDGMSAFHLYDTYGFPLELTKELAQEHGLAVDEDGFTKAFTEHQKKSRTGAEKKFTGGLADHGSETTKLHTATHLLNVALRKVLGDHVQQKGSNITADRLRFDFNHTDKMTKEQLEDTEKIVNDAILADLPVSYYVTTVDEAKKEGAIGVFDERYGEDVKVYVIGPKAHSTSSGRGEWSDRPFSLEICGGPHVARTGMIGSFKILKEESSSAGVRRIKAVIHGGPIEIDVSKEYS